MPRYAMSRNGSAVHIVKLDVIGVGSLTIPVSYCGMVFRGKTLWGLAQARIKDVPVTPHEQIGVCSNCLSIYQKYKDRESTSLRGLEENQSVV